VEKHLKKLEEILGGKFESGDSRIIPGAVVVDGIEYVYFSDDKRNRLRKQFQNLTVRFNPRNAKFGGVLEEGCKITLPTGECFHAIGYHGDIDGWRKDIEAGAEAQHILLAKIQGNHIEVYGGRSFPLSECAVEFT